MVDQPGPPLPPSVPPPASSVPPSASPVPPSASPVPVGARRDGPGEPPTRRRWLAGWSSPAELRAAATMIIGLAVLGAVLGLVWDLWSPPGPEGYVIAAGAVQADETEAFVAADGRFAVIVILVGLVAGLGVFFWKRVRGPAAVIGLGTGGVAGALLTDLIGHLLRGGRSNGPTNSVIRHLPLAVQAHGLLLLEGAVAVLVYTICVAFATDDDLGRPEPESVRVRRQMQHGRRDADAAGQLQQGDLSPQQFDRPV